MPRVKGRHNISKTTDAQRKTQANIGLIHEI